MGKLLKAAGSIASPAASLGLAFGKKLKANAADEINNPAKNNLYKKVNETVSKILDTKPVEKKPNNKPQKDNNSQDKVAKLAAENELLRNALDNSNKNISTKQVQEKDAGLKHDSKVQGIDIQKEMPNLYRNMQEQQNEAQFEK